MSKFYSQILSSDASFYIYHRPLTEVNVIVSFCVEFADKILIFAILKWRLLQQRATDGSFVFIMAWAYALNSAIFERDMQRQTDNDCIVSLYASQEARTVRVFREPANQREWLKTES